MEDPTGKTQYSLIATCLTREFGIQKTEIESDAAGRLPQFTSVTILGKDDSLKFDPRNIWDAWASTSIDPKALQIKVKHFFGSVYIQEDRPFMTPCNIDDNNWPVTSPWSDVTIGKL